MDALKDYLTRAKALRMDLEDLSTWKHVPSDEAAEEAKAKLDVMIKELEELLES